MRSKLGKALRKKFDERMKSLVQRFELDASAIAPPGCPTYFSTFWPGFTAYLGLTPSPKGDNFYIEVGWSTNGKYPDSSITEVEDLPADGDSRFRLNRLYDPQQYDGWHLSTPMTLDDDFFTFQEDPIEEALERIDSSLDEVFDKITTHVIPYFEQLGPKLKSRGLIL